MFIYTFWFLCRNPHITEADLSTLVSQSQKWFGFPANKPWRETIGDAKTILDHGRQNANAVRTLLGENWDNAIEW